MKKLGMLGIIGGAALLTAAPFSLQWSQENVALSISSAEARIAGLHRRVDRRTYRRAAYAARAAGVAGYGYGSYYGYTSAYYSSYRAPRPYSSYYRPVRSYVVRSINYPYPPPATAITCHPLRS